LIISFLSLFSDTSEEELQSGIKATFNEKCQRKVTIQNYSGDFSIFIFQIWGGIIGQP